jgi:DNA primase
MIPKDTVDRIIESARIEEVVGDFVSLKRRGVNMLGNCPFHNERTPSFTVSPAKGIYKCFGCGKAGNSVNFIMDHESLSYPEALRYLAKKYNIEIAEKELTAEDIQEQNERESLFVVNSYAQKYFSEQLWETENGKAIALSYFRERGFRDDIIEKFQLGYSPDEWAAFTDAAVKAGYKLEYLEKTGLTIVKEEGDKKFDRFKGRVMFPIHSITGRVLGFGGRVLKTEDKKQAKYVNSPESEIYNKSKVLYGAFFAKKSILQYDVCYLVEGYTDVISMHQAGVENVVASSGTSLTHDQIKLISRYTKNITILYDGDPAGIKASFRGIDMILEEGMNVRVVLFPDGDDPDSYAKKVSIDELKEYIGKSAKDFVSFKTSLLIDEIGNDPIKRAALVKDIAQTISKVPEGIQRQFYIKECSRLTGIDEQTLLREVNRLRFDNTRKEREAEQLKEEFVNYESDGSVSSNDAQGKNSELAGIDFSDPEWQERDIIRILLRHSDRELHFTHKTEDGKHDEVHTVLAGDFIIYELSRDQVLMQNPVYQAIYTGYMALQSKPEVLTEEGAEAETETEAKPEQHYDAQGYLIKAVPNQQEEPQPEFDEFGMLVTPPLGVVNHVEEPPAVEVEYDEDGFPIEQAAVEVEYDEEGFPIEQAAVEVEYDEEGFPIEREEILEPEIEEPQFEDVVEQLEETVAEEVVETPQAPPLDENGMPEFDEDGFPITRLPAQAEPEFDENGIRINMVGLEETAVNTGDNPHPTAHPDENVRRVASDLLIDKTALSERWYGKHRIEIATEDTSHTVLKSSIEKALHSLKMKFILKMIRELQDELATATDELDQMALLERQKTLDNIKTELSAILGRIILH